MAQPETAAGDVGNPADSNPADAFNELAEELIGEDQEEEEPAEGDDAEEADDEPEAEAEEEELPPIDAPVSWDAESKEAFAQLPRDLQETVQKREAERERFVQSRAQDAARAIQGAQQEASQQLAQLFEQHAHQYNQLAQQFEPQRPHPSLAQTDPATFYAMQAEYENATAQRQEMQQRASQYAQMAQAHVAQVEQSHNAEQYQILAENFPEYVDPTTAPKVQAELSAVARELGFPPELIAQARAVDILAMRTAADWKAKAAKYDALNGSKMAKVRAAKGLPKVATPGVAQGTDQLRANRANAGWERAKSGRNMAEKAEGFAEWASNSGIL